MSAKSERKPWTDEERHTTTTSTTIIPSSFPSPPLNPLLLLLLFSLHLPTYPGELRGEAGYGSAGGRRKTRWPGLTPRTEAENQTASSARIQGWRGGGEEGDGGRGMGGIFGWRLMNRLLLNNLLRKVATLLSFFYKRERGRSILNMIPIFGSVTITGRKVTLPCSYRNTCLFKQELQIHIFFYFSIIYVYTK